MRTRTLAIALALVACSDSSSEPPTSYLCEHPEGPWHATIAWGQGTCSLSVPQQTIDLQIVKSGTGYTVASSVGTGVLSPSYVGRDCTLSVTLTGTGTGGTHAIWTFRVNPDVDGAKGSGTFSASSATASCTHAFTILSYF